MSIKTSLTIVSLGLALLLSLACGGGGSSSSADTSQVTMRLAGGKAGDTVQVMTLNGAEFTTATFNSAGTASIKVGGNHSLRLYFKVKGKNSETISLFETLVTRTEIREAQKANKTLEVTINSATTVVAQDLSSSELAAIYAQELSERTTVLKTSPSNEQTKALFAASTDLAGLLNSKYGMASLSDLDLTSVSSSKSSGLSLLAHKIKRHAILSGLALRSADNGLLTNAGWEAVLVANNAIDSATDPLVAAQTLSNAIKTNMPTTAKVTTSDFGAELQAYLGTGPDITNILAGLQSGDASGALSLIQSASTLGSQQNYGDLGWAALQKNDVLSAYKYFSAGAASTSASDNTLVMSAMTRIIVMGLKDSDAATAFRKAMNINYNYKTTASLSSTLSQADVALEKNTAYGSRKDLAGVASIEDIVSYVKNGFLVDVEASLAELKRVSSSLKVTVDPKYQGVDHKGKSLSTSPLMLDPLDVKALQGALLLAKAKAEYFLSQNLKIDGVNSTAANTLNTLYSATGEEMYDGKVTMAGNWMLSSGSSESFSQLGLLGKTLTFVGGYPGELDLEGLTNLDGTKVYASIEKWDSGRHGWLTWSNPIFSGKSYTHVVEFDLTVDPKLLTGVLTTGASDYVVHAVGTFKALNGASDWVFTLKHKVYGYGYSYYMTDSIYTARYEVSSGSLSLNTTNPKITEDQLASWLEKNPNFLTVTTAFAEKSRDSLKASAQILSSVLDSLQAIDPVATPRINNLLESQEDLAHSNGDYFTDAETDGVQDFLEGAVESLYGATTVNPAVFGHQLEKTSLDLSVFFKKNFREEALVNGKAIQVTNSSGNISYEADETELRSDLSGMLVSDNLFGVNLSTVGSSNIEKVFAEVGDRMFDWIEGTRVKVTKLEKVTGTMGGVRVLADGGGNIFSFCLMSSSTSANVEGVMVTPKYEDSTSGMGSLLVIKRNVKNEVLWKQQLAGGSDFFSTRADDDKDGSMYVSTAVNMASANVLFPGVAIDSMNHHCQLVKLDVNGSVVWAKLFASPYSDLQFSAQGNSVFVVSTANASSNVFSMGQTLPDTFNSSLLPSASSAISKPIVFKINKATGAIEAISDLGLSSSTSSVYLDLATADKIFVRDFNSGYKVSVFSANFDSSVSVGPIASDYISYDYNTLIYDENGNIYFFLKSQNASVSSRIDLNTSVSVTLDQGTSLLAKYNSAGELLNYKYYGWHKGGSVSWMVHFDGMIYIMGYASHNNPSQHPFSYGMGSMYSLRFIQAINVKSEAFGQELGCRYFSGSAYPSPIYSDAKGLRLAGATSNYGSYPFYVNGVYSYIYGSVYNLRFPFNWDKDVVDDNGGMMSQNKTTFVTNPVPMNRVSADWKIVDSKIVYTKPVIINQDEPAPQLPLDFNSNEPQKQRPNLGKPNFKW